MDIGHYIVCFQHICDPIVLLLFESACQHICLYYAFTPSDNIRCIELCPMEVTIQPEHNIASDIGYDIVMYIRYDCVNCIYILVYLNGL